MAKNSIWKAAIPWWSAHRGVANPAVVLVVSLVLFSSVVPCAPQEERLSRFGRYEGYSARDYDSWVRISEYVTLRDGTRLAVDIIRQARDKKIEEKPLPVVWTHHRYRRAGRDLL